MNPKQITTPAPPRGAHRAHLEDAWADEAAAAAVEVESAQLLELARGIASGESAARGPATRRGGDVLGVLVLFALADQLTATTLTVLAPAMAGALGIAPGAFGLLAAQRNVMTVVLALVIAARMTRQTSRRAIATRSLVLSGLALMLASCAHSFGALFLAITFTSPTAAALWAVQRPMLMDAYPRQGRPAAVTKHQAGIALGAAIGPVGVLALTDGLSMTWRGVLFVLGCVLIVLAFAGVALGEPQQGQQDTEAVREAIRARLAAGTASGQETVLGLGETLRRLLLVPTFKRLLAAWAVLGAVLAPLLVYLSFYLQDSYEADTSRRAVFFTAAWVLAAVVMLLLARHSRRRDQLDPASLLRTAARWLLLLAAGLLVTPYVPSFYGALVGCGIILGLSGALIAALVVVTLTVVPSQSRAHAGALVATFMLVVGAQGGALVLGGLDHRFGPRVAIAVLALPALAASRLVARAIASVDGDSDHVFERVIEEEEVKEQARRGVRLPMLSCRHIDFSYGQLQVLFDVSLNVSEGEMVALLGTNGAGKSTLLRVISGLGLPSRGSVRLHGMDISFVDAERRVAMGISQVPGGRAIYGPLTVVENLRVMGFSQGRNRRAVEAGIETSFATFPQLAEKRNLKASMLSGGEQQMLGLSTAFLAKPQLLLIDELSLGLAPKIVGELLTMVRAINEAGTAIVLVEQSVNVALSVVEHAYFMEKGAIHFDGAARDLLQRPDLLRSVFLEGAGKALTGSA